jgi:RND family efflux transporter MFP subunit
VIAITPWFPSHFSATAIFATVRESNCPNESVCRAVFREVGVVVRPRTSACGLGLIAALSHAGCGRAIEPALALSQPAAAPAAASPAAPTPTNETGFLGVVMTPASVDLASQLEARLKRIKVRPGDRVNQGDILATLDSRAAKKELAMARAGLLNARADVARSQLELAQAAERLQRRTGTVDLPSGAAVNVVSQEDLSSASYQEKLAKVRLDAARATVLDRQAHYDALRDLAEEGAVRAPFNGVVAQRYVDEGSLVRKGAPIVRLIDSSELRVRFAVPEERAREVELARPVRMALDELTLLGTIEKIAPEIDSASRMIFVEASLTISSEQSTRVRAGQVGRVAVLEKVRAKR